MEELETPLNLMELMLEGIQSVFDGRGPDTIPVPPLLEQLAESQAKIGWQHVLRGRISQLWSQKMQEHIGGFDPKKNGTTWATTIISEILTGWLELWHLRNGDRHGRDAQSKQQAAKAQALRELEQLYDLKGGVSPDLEWIFDTPLQERMNMRTYHLRAFINSWKPVLEESYQDRLATR